MEPRSVVDIEGNGKIATGLTGIAHQQIRPSSRVARPVRRRGHVDLIFTVSKLDRVNGDGADMLDADRQLVLNALNLRQD